MSQGEVADSLAVEDGGVALAGHEGVEQLEELLEPHGEPTRRLASDRQGPSDVRATPMDRPDSSGRCLQGFASWGAALAGARWMRRSLVPPSPGSITYTRMRGISRSSASR